MKRAVVHPVKVVEPALTSTLIRLFVSAGMDTLEPIVDRVSQLNDFDGRTFEFIDSIATTDHKYFPQGYGDTSFLASFDYDPDTPGDPIVFNVAPLNPGGHYDITTGIYTVPVDGVYEFMYHIWLINDAGFYGILEVDNVQVSVDKQFSFLHSFIDLSIDLFPNSRLCIIIYFHS